MTGPRQGVRRPDRRRFLRQLVSGTLGIASFSALGRARADLPAPARPRYWLQIVPSGGIDAIWTTEPRTRREVAAGVEVPYRPGDIVATGAYPLAPSFAALARHTPELLLVGGVLVKAANHYTGSEQISRLRTATTTRTPSCLDIIGAHRDSSQAVGHVILGSSFREARTPGSLGDAAVPLYGGKKGLFELLDETSPEELDSAARALSTTLASLKRQGPGSYRDSQRIDALGQTRDLLSATARAPRFARATDAPEGDAAGLDRAVWLIENDLAATITVFTSFDFDTHFHNYVQRERTRELAESVSRLFDMLDSKRNRHGRLRDQTVVVMGSELGRFPYLNANLGKDHFPQAPFLLSGPGIGGGKRVCPLGTELELLPASLARGNADPSGRRPTLDDLGATTLALAGIAPRPYGIDAEELRFVRAT